MTFAGNTICIDVRSIMSCNVLTYITIFYTFPKPTTTTTAPTNSSHTGVAAKSDETYPIYFKSS
jgi:hypothetical protein